MSKKSSTTKAFLCRLLLSFLGLILGFFVFVASCSILIFGPITKEFLSFSIPFPPFAFLWEERSKWVSYLFTHSIEICFSILLGLSIAVFFFVIGFFIQRNLSNKKTIIHGSSRWAQDKELRESGLLSGRGVVMGQTKEAQYTTEPVDKPKRHKDESNDDYQTRLSFWKENRTQLVLDHEGKVISTNKNEHTLVVGATRSGKGVGCIIPTEFSWGESLIVFDPKCEGWEITSNFRSSFSYTFKFQPENPSESIHYNPLLSIRRGLNTIPDIQNLCYSLIAQNDNAKDPFWDDEGRRLLTVVIGYTIYAEA
ncbi:MAG: type IV secretory system conjugative DNA transfer family protein, partial [Candidatus Ornithospirochaeta sp.]